MKEIQILIILMQLYDLLLHIYRLFLNSSRLNGEVKADFLFSNTELRQSQDDSKLLRLEFSILQDSRKGEGGIHSKKIALQGWVNS